MLMNDGKTLVVHHYKGPTPPNKPCDAEHAGDQERVNYAATYLFYGRQVARRAVC